MYVAWRASSAYVRVKTFILGFVGVLLYGSMYMSAYMFQAGLIDAITAQTMTRLRCLLTSMVENTASGLIRVALLACDIIVILSGTRLGEIQSGKKPSMIASWGATVYLLLKALGKWDSPQCSRLLFPNENSSVLKEVDYSATVTAKAW